MADQEISQKNCYSITWTINNFSYCWQKKNEAIVSPIFSIHIPEETKWKLLLFPRGSSHGSCMAFHLNREQNCNGAENIEVEYSLEFLAADGSILTKGEIKYSFCKGSRWGYPRFQTRDMVFVTKRMKYLPQDILTARCRMKLRKSLSEKFVENRNIFARTIINVERKCLLWTIEEFSSLTPDQKVSFLIKSASGEPLIKVDLFLTGGQFSEEKINLSICPSGRCMKFFTMKTFILDASENDEVDAGEFECWCELGKYSLFTLNFSRSDLIRDGDIYLPNDSLSLKLELATSTGFAFEGVEKIDFGTIFSQTSPNEILENWLKCNAEEKITENSCALITDLMSLYKDQTLCDVKLQTKTNVFPVHSSILVARSPVFRAMFSTDMKEKIKGCIDVSDFNDKTIHQLLLYMYTDRLEELKCEDIFHLYEAADKYAITSLKDQCSLFLKGNLNLINACRTLIISDLHQDEDLKVIAQVFILKNAKEIFKSEEWKLLANSNSKLALETTLRNWNEE